MDKIKFKTNVSTSGNSHVLTIPSFFIKQDLVNPNKQYLVTLIEVKR